MTRRQLLTLVGLIMLGATLSYVLRYFRPIGLHVGDSALAARITADKESPQVGHGHADVTLVLFTDYRCGACRQADGAMRRAIARDGNVRVVYRDWPIFGERSERAARIALAAHHQGIYASVHHSLMSLQVFDDAELQKVIERSGGSWQQLRTDLLRHGPWIENQLAKNRQDAFSLGLKGTPGYLIGPFVIQGALSEREFLRVFDQARTELVTPR